MLNDAKIRAAKPTGARYLLSDGRGLYLLIDPSGGKWWRFIYKRRGKQRTLSLGVYPDVTLAKAREKLDDARRLVKGLKTPSANQGHSLESVSREWIAKQQPAVAPSTYTRNLWLFEKRVFPLIGDLPIGQLGPRDVLRVIQALETKGTGYTAHRTKQLIGQVLRYAVAHGWAERDITADLRGALAPVTVAHFPAITDPAKVGALLRAIDGLDSPLVRCALQLAALTFVRPGELRTAAWAEIDLPACSWRIPAAKMKQRQPHLVPLSRQAVAVLTAAHGLTRQWEWVFPAIRTPRRPMSDGTLNAALRRLGYGAHEMTAHGFRAMARTLLAEALHADPYIIEVQLAHAAPGPLGAAYNRALYLPQRVSLMQQWADYLDTLRK